MKTQTLAFLAAAGACSLVACKSSPAAPFDRLRDAQITVFRLQNYEPPATVSPIPQAGQAPGVSMIPGLPPEITSWVQQGAQGMGSLIPPGLFPPGLIPGQTAQPTAASTVPAADASRFEGFRILGQTQVLDTKIRDQLIDILGYENNFESRMSPCLYPELGISFAQPAPMLPDNILVSFSCNRLESKNFQWPFPDKGLKQETVRKFSEVTQKLFGGG